MKERYIANAKTISLDEYKKSTSFISIDAYRVYTDPGTSDLIDAVTIWSPLVRLHALHSNTATAC